MKKTAIVTGGSRGIGKSIVENLAGQGYRVLFTYYQSQVEAEKICTQLNKKGLTVSCCQVEASQRTEVRNMVKEFYESHQQLDLLVNNAGISEQRLFQDISETQWQRMLDVNLSGPFWFAQAAGEIMIKQKFGKIINVASMWGEVGAACEVHYSASKAGLIGLTKALAKELGPSNIQVNCLAPGAIKTDMMAGFSMAEIESIEGETPLGRLGSPADVARAVTYLAKESGDFITGQVLSINGGYVI